MIINDLSKFLFIMTFQFDDFVKTCVLLWVTKG